MTIKTEPPGATVIAQKTGNKLGETPLEIRQVDIDKIREGEFAAFTITRKGYRDSQVVLHIDGINNFTMKMPKLSEEHFRDWVLHGYGARTNVMTRKLLEIQGFVIVKQMDRAKTELINFQEKYPNIAASYTMLGNIYYYNKDFGNARSQLLRALVLDKDDSTAQRLLNMTNRKMQTN